MAQVTNGVTLPIANQPFHIEPAAVEMSEIR
jgi:hypothetical protein